MSDDKITLFDLELDRLEQLGAGMDWVMVRRSELAMLVAEVRAARAKLGATWPCGFPEPIVEDPHEVNMAGRDSRAVAWPGAFDDYLSPDEAEGIGAKLIEMAQVARRGG